MLKVMGSVEVGSKRLIVPHLYFTYIFIGLVSSVTYEVFGRAVLTDLFGWYYRNGLGNYLMALGALEMIVRTTLVNERILH